MKRAIIGISGGVDSAVAAHLLKQQGYEVTAVFLEMHEYSHIELPSAKEVSEKLGIKFVVLDLKQRFSSIVINNFIHTYMSGATPNPCVVCNKNLKFQALYDYCIENGYDIIATGHYAEALHKDNRYFIHKIDDKKDQSYMLYSLTQEQLSKLYLPLSRLNKEQVRNIAKENGICVFNKADSQEICFIKENYTDFIKKNSPIPIIQGEYVLEETGEVLGKHKGIIHYTVGQRKGLAISYKCPLYVSKIDVEKNIVYLSNNDIINSTTCNINNINLQKLSALPEQLSAFVKVRYSSNVQRALVKKKTEITAEITFLEPIRAITKGQSAVVYDECSDILCGGIIY